MAKKNEITTENVTKRTRSRRRVVADEPTNKSESKAKITAKDEAAPADEASEPTLYRAVLSNKASFLNLRNGAGQSYKRIAKIPDGGVMECTGKIVETGDSFGWLPVRYEGIEGFVFAGKVEIIER